MRKVIELSRHKYPNALVRSDCVIRDIICDGESTALAVDIGDTGTDVDPVGTRVLVVNTEELQRQLNAAVVSGSETREVRLCAYADPEIDDEWTRIPVTRADGQHRLIVLRTADFYRTLASWIKVALPGSADEPIN